MIGFQPSIVISDFYETFCTCWVWDHFLTFDKIYELLSATYFSQLKQHLLHIGCSPKPELQLVPSKIFGDGRLILDPWFCSFFLVKQPSNLHANWLGWATWSRPSVVYIWYAIQVTGGYKTFFMRTEQYQILLDSRKNETGS